MGKKADIMSVNDTKSGESSEQAGSEGMQHARALSCSSWEKK